MLNNWAFFIAFLLLVGACSLDVYIFTIQLKEFRHVDKYQPLKRMLAAAILFVLFASLPLALVYANILWFHFSQLWIVYVAVIGNAIAKLLFGLAYLVIYKTRIP